MDRTPARAMFAAALLALAPAAALAADGFAGRYGHDMTATPGEAVWTVRAQGEAWQVVREGDGETVAAHELSASGRTRFWERMQWPAATAAQARCLGWGERPPSLDDLLGEAPAGKPASTTGDDYGEGVLCVVDGIARAKIDWIADHASDWFYYDPFLGVTEVVRLP